MSNSSTTMNRIDFFTKNKGDSNNVAFKNKSSIQSVYGKMEYIECIGPPKTTPNRESEAH